MKISFTPPSSRYLATYSIAVEAKLPQKLEPVATKPVKYETKTLTNGAKVIARNAWSEVCIPFYLFSTCR